MPPSPSMRRSPSENMKNHKRGRSFDVGLIVKEKDDNLALFNDLHDREKDNFLIPGTKADLDDAISMKLRYFSDFKLGLTIPRRVDRNNLLNADSEKTDYDWLLTPPDTPLFPSLDDETPPSNLAQRGRIQTRPISISRSATMEKNYSSRPSRTSASPCRLSPSPRSTTSTLQSRDRPSSAPNSNYIRQSLGRSSTPPGKPRYQTPRASTPTARRMSTGSSGYPSSHRRDPSPVRSNCGNSGSSKLNAWQSNIPGFSSDAPPNLRTTLADRPASYVRGTSPASSNGKDATNRYRRQSTSPKVSRNTNSVDSHDRDRFSSHSKGSVVSSCDDDIDSLQSTLRTKDEDILGDSGHPITNSKGLKFSKRTVRPLSSGSAPKWSLDSAMHQMDHGKNPQSMFKPLLSSGPSTSFYVRKSNPFHERLMSLTSSVTTSSNTSSEQGASAAHDTDASDHELDGLFSEWKRPPFPDVEEVLSHEKVESLCKDRPDMKFNISDFKRRGDILHLNAEVKHPNADRDIFETHGETRNPDAYSNIFETHAVAEAVVSECLIITHGGCEMNSGVSVPEESVAGSYVDLISTCSKCGKKFLTLEIFDDARNICQSCIDKDNFLSCHFQSEVTPSNATDMHAEAASEVSCSNDGQKQSELGINIQNGILLSANLLHDGSLDGSPIQQEGHEEHQTSCLMEREIEQHLVDDVEINTEEKYTTDSYHNSFTSSELVDLVQPQDKLDCTSVFSQVQIANAHPSLRFEASEASGISLLLSRSSSENWPVVHGMFSAASNITSDNSSSLSSHLNPMTGLSYMSSSSSTDATSIKQEDAHFQWQSSRKSDLESPRTYSSIKAQCPEPISPGITVPLEGKTCSRSFDQEKIGETVLPMKGKGLEDAIFAHDEKIWALENVKLDDAYLPSVEIPVHEHDELNVKVEQLVPTDAYCLKLLSNSVYVELVDISDADVQDEIAEVFENCHLVENAESHYPSSCEQLSEKDLRMLDIESSSVNDITLTSKSNLVDVVDTIPHDCSVSLSGDEGERDEGIIGPSYSKSAVPPSANHNLYQQPDTSTVDESGSLCDVTEPEIVDHATSEKGEVTKVEDPNSYLTRNTTSEEATDTILFCNSISQSLAYRAATIAVEKEESLHLGGSRSTITILSKSDRPDTRNPRVSSGKRTQRLQKHIAEKSSQTNDSTPMNNIEETKVPQTKIHVTVPKRPDSMKPPKVKARCNCSIM